MSEINATVGENTEVTNQESQGQEIAFTCKDCGETFYITEEELRWYQERGLFLPKRCPECRVKNKEKKAAEGGKKPAKKQKAEFVPAPVESTEIVCSECGATFVMEPEEITWFNDHKYALPKKCPDCRAAAKKAKKAKKDGTVATLGDMVDLSEIKDAV